MPTKYQEYSNLDMPEIGREWLKEWEKKDFFKKSIDQRSGKQPFVFYEGPPSANGLPGIHHVISRTLKDLICRYKTMQGFQVNRKAGWDTHGLPVELGVEKELGIRKDDIGKKISVEEYNRKCREAVMRYKDLWDKLTTQMGYWVNLDDPYITFENDYIETLWWALKELFKDDLLYKSVSIQPYSPAAGSGLSSHELNQPGTYWNVKDVTCVAMFKALDNEQAKALLGNAASNTFFLAWTTTPWTLPSNAALTVGGKIDYALVETFNPYTNEQINVIVGLPLLGTYFKQEGESNNLSQYDSESKILLWKILKTFKGKDLEGLRYEQLLSFESNRPELSGGDPFRIILGDFVTTEDGTGIVHTAPAFGADDFKVGKTNNIGFFNLVDKQGRFIPGTGEYSGRFVKDYLGEPNYQDPNLDIALYLKKSGRAFKVEKYEHSYPHCWRTDKPVIYYPLDAWFIRTTALKERMIALNKKINWKPKATGEKRFGNWLENMVDWNLSRSRFWGTPLPIWVNRNSFSLQKDSNPVTSGSNPHVVGNKKDLIGDGDYTGYYFQNKEQFVSDIQNSDSDLRKSSEKIQSENKDESQLFQLDLDSILGLIKNNKEIFPIDLIKAGFGFSLIKDYLIEIDESFVETLDLHKPYIDNVLFRDKKSDDILYRESELIDVWFDSGAMPYAQWHFPFENKELFAQNYPADFIAEGVDQTRGWFYTLHALGALLKESVAKELEDAGLPVSEEKYPGLAYKTVIANGLVLDKDGNKMSKRVGNVIDPFKTIEKYSADATRWYLITNAAPWESLRFDTKGIVEVQRRFFGTIFNVYQFFALYANVDGFCFEEDYIPIEERQEMDQWILSALNSLVKEVTADLDNYEPTQAGRSIENFVDEQLSNWYVRLNRRRFWKGDYEQDKIAAYQTLYECMEKLSQLIAPIAPFFADWLFNNLNTVSGKSLSESVHLTDFPKCNESVIDIALEERMHLAQTISSLILSLRKKEKIRVRQPLQRVLIPVLDNHLKEQIEKVQDIILSETNLKEISLLTDSDSFIKKEAKPDFRKLGKRAGKDMRELSTKIANLSKEQLEGLENGNSLDLIIGNTTFTIAPEEVAIIATDIPGWSVISKDQLTVALDIQLTKSLEEEGSARELINRIQKLRKEGGFELTDRIVVQIQNGSPLTKAIQNYGDYIRTEVLADDIDITTNNIPKGIEVKVNDYKIKVFIYKSA